LDVNLPCFWCDRDLSIDGLLVKTWVMVTIVAMVTVMHDHHNLRLHGMGHCNAEKEDQADARLPHNLL